MLEEYTRYNSRRKPELLSPKTYSLTNYREAERVVNDYNDLADRAENIYNELPEEYKDAYYQLVLYPVKACANLNDLYVTAAKNNLYAGQGRVETNELAEKVKKLFETDEELTAYYNKVMSGGKWDHMMDQTHIGYTYWQQPDQNKMPEVKTIKVPAKADMGVAIEGSENWWPNSKDKALLPEFDPINNQKYYIEIFSRGSESFNYSIKTGDPCIVVDNPNGIIKTQNRIFVSVDWTKAPMGKKEIPITIAGPNGNSVAVNAVINNSNNKEKIKGFVENNGCISIEAQHYSKAVGGSEIKWVTIPDLGRTLSGVTPFPVTASAQNPGDSNPHLEYNIDLQNTGSVKVNVYLSPTLNFTNSEHGIRFAVSFDDEKPQIINMTSNPNPPDLNRDRVWNGWVANNINIQTTTHNNAKSGEHTLKIWMVDPGIVIQKIVIDAGGEKPSYLGPPESLKM